MALLVKLMRLLSLSQRIFLPRFRSCKAIVFRNFQPKDEVVTLNYRMISSETTVKIADNFHVLIMDRKAAYTTWVPEWNGGAAIVQGPYIIRSAERSANLTLALRGDLNQTQVDVEINTDDDIDSVTFNSRMIFHYTHIIRIHEMCTYAW